MYESNQVEIDLCRNSFGSSTIDRIPQHVQALLKLAQSKYARAISPSGGAYDLM
jgi:hypothetical protein